MSVPRRLRTLFRGFLLVAALPAAVAAQGVLVAPQGITIDHRVRSASFEVYNPGTDRTEIAIGTVFGYPVSDSAGQTVLFTTEAPDSTAPSAAAWIQAYPRRLVLGPGERQTIRLFARPPAALPDGEYWTRVVVAARPATQIPIAADSGVRAGITLEVRTIVAAWYRKGALTTTLALDSVAPVLRGDTVTLRAALTRTGSAAWIGMARLALADSTGAVVARQEYQLAVYYGLRPEWPLRTGALAPGRYTVRLVLDPARDDIPREQRVVGNALAHEVSLVVPRRAAPAAPTGPRSP